jgi:hypothetical protein
VYGARWKWRRAAATITCASTHESPRPFGTWPSPITAQVAASQGLRLAAPVVDGGDIYWLEARPAEGGRNVVVRSRPTACSRRDARRLQRPVARSTSTAAAPTPFIAGTVFFSNFADQRLYRVDRPEPGRAITPVPITPEGTLALQRRDGGRRARPLDLRARRPHGGRARVRQRARGRRRRRQQRRGRRARGRLRLLFHAAPQSGRARSSRGSAAPIPTCLGDGTELWVADGGGPTARWPTRVAWRAATPNRSISRGGLPAASCCS